jgi:hypothetical protein
MSGLHMHCIRSQVQEAAAMQRAAAELLPNCPSPAVVALVAIKLHMHAHACCFELLLANE